MRRREKTGCTRLRTTATACTRGSTVTKIQSPTGLDWSHRYWHTIELLPSLKAKSAYFGGELCALNADGVSVFSRLQAAMDEGRTDQPIFFALDLLYLNGESTALLPLSSSRSDCIA